MCKTLTDLQMLMHNLSKRNPTSKVVLFSYVVKPGTYLCVKTSRMLRYFLSIKLLLLISENQVG